MAFAVFMQQIPERDSRTVSSHIVSDILQSAVNGTLLSGPAGGWHNCRRKNCNGILGFQDGSSLSIVLSGVLFPLLRSGLTFVARHRVQIVVFGGEMLIIGYSKLIIRFSQGKTEDEVRGVEVEHAVIEYGVNATCIVLRIVWQCVRIGNKSLLLQRKSVG